MRYAKLGVIIILPVRKILQIFKAEFVHFLVFAYFVGTDYRSVKEVFARGMLPKLGIEQLHVRPEALVVAVCEHIVAGRSQHQIRRVVNDIVVYLVNCVFYGLNFVVELRYLRVCRVYAL